MERINHKPIVIKYIATGYFILIGILNLADTIWNSSDYIWRDMILLVIASLPLLINKRLFYIGFGILLSIITLLILLTYISMHDFIKPAYPLITFIMGVVFHICSFACSLGMIYVGTYNPIKNTFRLI